MYQLQPQKKSSSGGLLLLIAIIVGLFWIGPKLGLDKQVKVSLAGAGQHITSSVNSRLGTGANQVAGNSYRDVAWNDAIAAGIPAQLFVNQINEESGFNPTVQSPSGAVGIAQLMPSTAAEWGVNPYDADASLRVASQHMATFYHTYGDNYAKALAAYNAGPGGLQNALSCGSSWESCLPAETQNYIHAVMG